MTNFSQHLANMTKQIFHTLPKFPMLTFFLFLFSHTKFSYTFNYFQKLLQKSSTLSAVIQTILLDTIGGRKYSELETVGGNSITDWRQDYWILLEEVQQTAKYWRKGVKQTADKLLTVHIVDKLSEEGSIAHTIPCAHITLLTVMQTVGGRECSNLTDNTIHYYTDCWRQVAILSARQYNINSAQNQQRVQVGPEAQMKISQHIQQHQSTPC